MGALLGISTSFGLAAAAGFSTYVPLLVISALACTRMITLASPFDVMGDWRALAIIAALYGLDLLGGHYQQFRPYLRQFYKVMVPVVGAVAFAAWNSTISDMHPLVSLMFGLITAGAISWLKPKPREMDDGERTAKPKRGNRRRKHGAGLSGTRTHPPSSQASGDRNGFNSPGLRPERLWQSLGKIMASVSGSSILALFLSGLAFVLPIFVGALFVLLVIGGAGYAVRRMLEGDPGEIA